MKHRLFAHTAACVALALQALLLAGVAHAAAPARANPAASTVVMLDRLTGSRPLKNGVALRSGTAVMEITALRDDVLRVRAGARGELPEDASWAVLPQARTASVAVTPESDAESVGFRTGTLRVKVMRSTLAMRITDLNGIVVQEDEEARPVEYHGTAFRVYKRSPADEHYFGLGDKPGSLDRRNQAFSMWNTDSFGFQESTDPIYKSIPFFLTMREGRTAGVFLDNTFRTSFDFNKEVRDAYSFGAPDGPLDYYVMYGPEPKKVVSAYAWLTGATPLPPVWSLGYQQSRYSYYPESEVRGIANKLRDDRIPADVIWLDIDYQKDNRPFTVDTERFPHFAEMIRDLRKQDFRVVTITDLHIAKLPNAGYAPYDTGVGGDRFVKNPDGSTFTGPVWPGPSVFPDFTQASTRTWWGSLYKEFVGDGVAGFWNDMNEPAVFNTPTKTMPDTVQHRIDEPGFRKRTATHLEIHNVYGMENSRGTFEGMQTLSPTLRPFVMTRASYAGGQRYATTWTGDNSSTWNHLRMTTPTLLNLGLSGFAMSGADVGGFAGTPQPNLLTRWLEIAAFQPIDRDHTAKGTAYQEPWIHGQQQENIRRHYIEERYRLMPYLYATAEEMSRTGLPITRPLFLEFPEATKDRHPLDLDAEGEFMFGPDLLVAPSPYPDKLDYYEVQLPPGGWYDYWTGGRIERESKITSKDAEQTKASGQPSTAKPLFIHPSLDVLPVYVREGAIVPMQPLVQSTAETPQGPLTLRVYAPHAPARGDERSSEHGCAGAVYLDDGVSMNYQHGASLRMSVRCEAAPDGLTIHVGKHEGSYPAWWKELRVEVYGLANEGGGASEAEWSGAAGPAHEIVTYDSEHHVLLTTVPDNGQGGDVKISYKAAEPAR